MASSAAVDIVELVINSVAALGTIVAIFISVWISSRTERRTGQALARERRLEHELELLRDIGDLVARGGPDQIRWDRRLRTMLLTLPGDEDLPVLRAFVKARSTPEGAAKLQTLVDELIAREPMYANGHGTKWAAINGAPAAWEVELEEAIDRRLTR